jgi:ATP-dependent protease ClpP protease subunit
MRFWGGMHPPPGWEDPGRGFNATTPADLAVLELARRNSRAAARRRSPQAQPAAAPACPPLSHDVAFITAAGKLGETITAAGVYQELSQAKARGARAVLMTVNSVGGDSLQAFSAVNMMRFAGLPIVGFVPYRAESAATLLALACDFLVLAPAAHLMIHRSSGGTEGARAAVDEQLEEFYATRTMLGRSALHGILQCCGDFHLDPVTALADAWVDELGDASRAEEVAREVAAAWPCWPARAESPRHAALAACAARRAAQ